MYDVKWTIFPKRARQLLFAYLCIRMSMGEAKWKMCRNGFEMFRISCFWIYLAKRRENEKRKWYPNLSYLKLTRFFWNGMECHCHRNAINIKYNGIRHTQKQTNFDVTKFQCIESTHINGYLILIDIWPTKKARTNIFFSDKSRQSYWITNKSP